jgi:hypothetical protein
MEIDRIVEAVTSDVTLMTSDRINALTGGHGGAIFAGINAANQLTEAMLAGHSPKLDNLNARSTSLDELIGIGVDAAKAAGATPSNAALVTAMLLYLRGTRSRSGIPAANRKLGALCRIHAGAERGGVCQIPTPKMGNKISGFPAVQALYDQARRKKLTRIDSRYLPFAAFAGTAWGHSTLGEDIIMPEVAMNGARAATRAMIEAYQGVGTPASPLFAAIFGAAAVAEVLHGDAAAPEAYGPYDKKAQTDAIYLAGLAAVEEAGLVPEFHLLGSRRAFDSARFVADLGLILKDIGAPTVVGMLWLSDLLSCFEESGRSTCMAIGTVNPPLGHTPTQFLPMVMDFLLEEKLDLPAAAERFREFRAAYSFDGETALVSTYIVAQKSTELGGGPITELWLQASREPMLEAVTSRAEEAARELESGRSLTEVVRGFEQRRQATVEQRVGAMMGQMMGRDISLRYLTIEPQARRSDPVTKKYLAFDARIDVEVTIDGKTQRIEHLLDRAVPNTVKPGLHMLKKRIMAWLGRRLAKVGPGEAWLIPHSLDLGVSAGAMGATEFTYAGAVIVNITVPAAVDVALGLHSASEAAEIATRAAYISSAIPGSVERAREVGEKLARP